MEIRKTRCDMICVIFLFFNYKMIRYIERKSVQNIIYFPSPALATDFGLSLPLPFLFSLAFF